MEKKAKITRTTFKNEWTSPQGSKVFFHDIELDNGDKGSIGTKEQMPSKLNPGQELTYTIEGNKIKAVVGQQAGFAGGGKKGPDPKVQIVGFAMSYTKDLIIADKVKIDQLSAMFDKIHGIMLAKISS
jgi:hypothetical protein